MSKIPTAEEFLYQEALKFAKRSTTPEKYHESMAKTISGIPFEDKWQKEAMIEFAKLHVAAALEAAAKDAALRVEETDSGVRYMSHFSSYNNHTYIVAKDTILNAYPDNLIQ